MDYIYVPFRVEPGELEKAQYRASGPCTCMGLNVTIPHKVAVLAFLDELDDMAENLGAVNTVVNDDGA